ncbi:hypothetical protein COR50_20400 [Chitinophaga caeni]|uniref:Uncharacterized protein n=2 Tax=Chitinophaga caeni TaxID=2029983 RepID=A0A291QZH3_9BACT|nr:hypothetical protein COR50_20400 [Chitinophaga caeni]
MFSLCLVFISHSSQAQRDTTEQPTWVVVALDTTMTWPTFGQCPGDVYAFLLYQLNFRTGKRKIRPGIVIPLSLKIGRLGSVLRFQIPMIPTRYNRPFIEEVKRVVRLMPRWNPAFHLKDGKREAYKSTVYLHVCFNRKFYIDKIQKAEY